MNIDLAQFEETNKINALIPPDIEYQVATGHVLMIVFRHIITDTTQRVDVIYKNGEWNLRPVLRARRRDYFSEYEVAGMIRLMGVAIRVAQWLNINLKDE